MVHKWLKTCNLYENMLQCDRSNATYTRNILQFNVEKTLGLVDNIYIHMYKTLPPNWSITWLQCSYLATHLLPHFFQVRQSWTFYGCKINQHCFELCASKIYSVQRIRSVGSHRNYILFWFTHLNTFLHSTQGDKAVWLPSAFFGGFSLLAGGLSMILPETKGKNLDEDDAQLTPEQEGDPENQRSDAGHSNHAFSSQDTNSTSF